MKFLINQQGDIFVARMPLSPHWQFGIGRNTKEAIGDLLISYPYSFGIEIEDWPPTPLDGLAAANVGISTGIRNTPKECP